MVLSCFSLFGTGMAQFELSEACHSLPENLANCTPISCKQKAAPSHQTSQTLSVSGKADESCQFSVTSPGGWITICQLETQEIRQDFAQYYDYFRGNYAYEYAPYGWLGNESKMALLPELEPGKEYLENPMGKGLALEYCVTEQSQEEAPEMADVMTFPITEGEASTVHSVETIEQTELPKTGGGFWESFTRFIRTLFSE